MQYLLMLYSDESGWNALSPQEKEQGLAAYMAYGDALKKAGVFINSNRLRPISDSTTVHSRTRSPRL